MTSKQHNKPHHVQVKMHSRLLHLRPHYYEEQYFSQLESLDLINCLITPIFFASTLSRWPRSFLSSVYCVVLAIKGYQAALLMLPEARRVHAHSKARYWLIFAERALRQFIATPALGRGQRFVQYMLDATAADPGPVTAFKLAMLVCGITHAFWNAFCLPLDFVSQAFINTLFFFLHFPPVVGQVAYAVGMLVTHKPRLVWLQWGLERGLQEALAGVQSIPQLLAGFSSLLRTPFTQLEQVSAPGSSILDAQQQQQPQQWMDPYAAVSLAPQKAPDLDSPAGRLVLALTTAAMLFFVLYAPLYFVWRLERHMKSRFMSTLVCSGKTVSEGDTSVSCRQSDCGWDCGSSDGSHRAGDSCPISSSEEEEQETGYVRPPAVFPVLPPASGALGVHMAAAAVVCFAVAEVFVGLCCVSPAVAGILWKQIPPG